MGTVALQLQHAGLELEVPAHRVLFVGGGYISFEFENVPARAGTRVTIIRHGARSLNAFDHLVARSAALGMDVRLGAAVTSIHKAGTLFTVHAEAHGTTFQVDADVVVHGAGASP